ncbi:hypothetical protein SNOG_02037 [Parastagonospora nodorum SN15]|uniref:Uncharacterized protein n=1 Tax=Phaeosphaeria nodorum (strain SN15 / ATCC MYA-4574 / FGSC 10173) TaxID=321614 RepID=Q0V1S7_PHANO|nr:hypothetical protein SNOG_02037 [Parastagonospora nodorum SN15]EAT90249.1 hypothetical protein SNOG_02037 [Parastagonospora nodorum SN15]
MSPSPAEEAEVSECHSYDLVANWSPCLTECVVESERRYLEEWLHSLTRLQSRARLPILGDKHKPLSSLRVNWGIY